MLRFYDKIPVMTLPDERLALADTGCSGAEIVANREQSPVVVKGRSIRPALTSIALDTIAQKIGAPRLDVLVGASLLYGGFTMDLRLETFEFKVTEERADEVLAAIVPYVRPRSGDLMSPVVEVEMGGRRMKAVFDTGAPYSLWKNREEEPESSARVERTDFLLGARGELIEFPVWMRPVEVGFASRTFKMDVAYMPDSQPSYFPECIIGMDVVGALRVSRMVLDPDAGAFRFYRAGSAN